MRKEDFLTKYNPTISKYWLLVLAGVMWSGIGLLLSGFALSWWTAAPSWTLLLLAILGFGSSWGVYRFGFSKIARKNIARILRYEEKACLFSFQAWSGYLIIAIMMTGGIVLKASPIPKPWLAVVYAAVGGGLFLSSFLYYARFAQEPRMKIPSSS
jgi:hypothetical protein